MTDSLAAAPASLTASAGARRMVLSPVGRAIEEWALALPLLVLVALFLVAPVVQLVLGSVTNDDGLTLEYWQRSLANRNDQNALRTSLLLGALVATIATALGVPLAWLLSRMRAARRAGWIALLNVAANFSGIGLGFAFLATLGGVGMLTLALHGLGLPWEPPAAASFTGMAIGYLYTNVPLFVLLTIPAMAAVRDEWWEAAQTASASRPLFWRAVGVPVLAPFIAAGWLLVFTWSVGIYGIAFALASGGAAEVRLLTLQIGLILQSSVFGQERAYVLAVELILIASLSLVAYRILLRRAVRWLA